MSDDYGRSYDEGRSGNIQSGGNSIDYAGYQAGRDAAFRAELSRSGGPDGGGVGAPMGLTGKAMRIGLICGLIGIPIGAFKDPTVWGAVLGFAGGVGVGVALRLGIEVVAWPFKKVFGTVAWIPPVVLGGVLGTVVGGQGGGFVGAGILFVVWLVRRRMA